MKRENIFALLLLTVLGTIACRNCFDILIPADNYTQFYFFDKGFASGFFESARSSGAYFSGLSFLYLLYLMIGSSPAGWVIACLLLHIINAFLIFLIANQLVRSFAPALGTFPALFASALFLLSPYQAEAVLWGTVGARWLFHSASAFAGIYLFLLYLESPSAKKSFALHLLFLIALFSNETALVLPAIYILFFFLYKITGRTDLYFLSFIRRFGIFQAASILALFIATRLYMGHWFWHGGTLEEITSSSGYMKTLLKYFAKFFLFYRYLPNEQWDAALRTLSANLYFTGSLLLAFLAALYMVFSKLMKTKKGSGYLLGALFLGFIIFLLPVLPLDSSFLSFYYPDRYGYIASAFFYSFISIGSFVLLKRFSVPVLAALTVFCLVLLSHTISGWTAVNDHCNKLVENYSPFLKYDRVYVLNEPSYYNGIVAFRFTLSEALYYRHDRTPAEKIRIVSGCYQVSGPEPSLAVKINGNTVEVKGPPRSTPYFCTGGWARSYQTEEYDVVYDRSGCSYVIKFKKEIPPNSAFIYAEGNNWKKAG